MDQHALLLQTLIDSVKNLTNEVSSLKNKVEALEEENKNLKQQLNLTTSKYLMKNKKSWTTTGKKLNINGRSKTT